MKAKKAAVARLVSVDIVAGILDAVEKQGRFAGTGKERRLYLNPVLRRGKVVETAGVLIDWVGLKLNARHYTLTPKPTAARGRKGK